MIFKYFATACSFLFSFNTVFWKADLFILMKSNLPIYSSLYHVLGLYLRNLTNPRLQNFLTFHWQLYNWRFTCMSLINLITFYIQCELCVEINFCIQMNSFLSMFWKEYFSPLIIFDLLSKINDRRRMWLFSALSLLHQSFCLCWHERQSLWITISL